VDEVRIGCKIKECPYQTYNSSKADNWAIESLSLHDASGYLISFTHPGDKDMPFKALLHLGQVWPQQDEHITSQQTQDSPTSSKPKLGLHCTLACKADRPTYLFNEGLKKDLPVG